MHLHDDGTLSLSPSDVTAFLACEHLTTLSLAAATRRDRAAGRRRTSRRSSSNGRATSTSARTSRPCARQFGDVREIEFEPGGWDEAQAATLQAMRDGVDVVFQAAFSDGGWRGLADFLLRVEKPSELGAWSYEALDTKLARSAKPAYILQLLFYNEQLARLQGREPDEIHVLLGSGEQRSFRPDEFGAYYRRVRARLERFVADPPATEPLPVDHCGICDFKPLCDEHWDRVDHLSRVAGVYRSQIEKLEAAGITTLAELGARAARAGAGRARCRHVGQGAGAGGAPAVEARARA